ncbi:DUF4913 domain-containing protein [Streptomyces sp. DK15]|uniref:DUF4913 domain-containing protein n=1 Tax=Streptomyces sp. DK15 TaxID=2957499 RepID=UPI0029AFAEAC|nr:DUF4913 domain-containing protein [Streptomyces sp. DK15]MDX2394931.1 DUF4913 domain-containing protein [Streptomyces sp. DK15]
MADDEGLPDFDVPVAPFQDLEDLKATVNSFTSQFKALADNPGNDPGGNRADDAHEADSDADDEDEPQYPPFILLLDPPEYDDELRALIEWVEGVLVPAYLGEPSADARWCHRWFEHTVAVARLHAAWLAWQELTDPATSGYLGPSTWHRDHLDPCLRELRTSSGPFAGCTKGEHQIGHRMPGIVPSAWRLAED